VVAVRPLSLEKASAVCERVHSRSAPAISRICCPLTLPAVSQSMLYESRSLRPRALKLGSLPAAGS
jgi:hypothetical protein